MRLRKVSGRITWDFTSLTVFGFSWVMVARLFILRRLALLRTEPSTRPPELSPAVVLPGQGPGV